mmetsp:Transcript_7484/g.12701  ORF Transcript_7484/g.12701 Transcript_7484/m.12701 type:complete len:83 (-) Transcript_7484:69-317(-)
MDLAPSLMADWLGVHGSTTRPDIWPTADGLLPTRCMNLAARAVVMSIKMPSTTLSKDGHVDMSTKLFGCAAIKWATHHPKGS